jgi:DDE_Tnp_1-associated
VPVTALYEALQQVKDGRKKRGCRYPLALILTLLLLARLAGETNVRAAAQWIRLRKGWIIEQLHLTRASLPCQGTYLYALERIDAQELLEVVANCLTRWEAAERCENEASRLSDLTGKQDKKKMRSARSKSFLKTRMLIKAPGASSHRPTKAMDASPRVRGVRPPR